MLDLPSALELAYVAVEEALRLKASYADARLEARWRERVTVTQGRLTAADAGTERGLAVRVLHGGAWGFAAVVEPTRHDVGVAVRRAIELARAAAILQEVPVELAAAEAARGADRVEIRRDPMGVPLADKLELLRGLDGALRRAPDVDFAQADFQAERRRGVWVSSEGAELEQDRVYTGLAAEVGASGPEGPVARSLLGGPGLLAGQGWELLEGLSLEPLAEGLVDEALALRDAAPCPDGVMDLVLGAPEVAAQLARGVAPLFELDRVSGVGPHGRAGSFLEAGDLGSRRFGSERLSLSADGRLPGGAGSGGFDAEGVPGERFALVQQGRVAGFLSGRETAASVGLERSQGCMRSSGWFAPPRPRLTNLILEPGADGDLEALVASTERGILVEGPRGFSLDPTGHTFVARGESGWLIEQGRRTRRVRSPSYRGATEAFWGACAALGGPDAAQDVGRLAADGLPIGVRAVPARFSGVEVGARDRQLVEVPADGALPLALAEPEALRPRAPVRVGPRTRGRRPRRDVK